MTTQAEIRDALSFLTGNDTGTFGWPYPSWLFEPNIQALGMSRRTVAGRPTEEWALKVYVDAKVPIERLGAPAPPFFRIPGRETEVPVDVEPIGKLRAQSGEIHGGNRVFNANHRDHLGTIGCLLQPADSSDSRTYLLTCAHVLAPDGNGQVDDRVLCRDSGGQEIDVGRLVAWTTAGENPGATIVADAAVAELDRGVLRPEVLEIGLPSATTGSVSHGEIVRLYGGESQKVISLVVDDVDFIVPDDIPDLTPKPRFRYIKCVSCRPYDGITNFGDSGAAVFNREDRLLGLHFFGTDRRAVFCRIESILRFFRNMATPLNLEVVTRRSLRTAPNAPSPQADATRNSTMPTEATPDVSISDGSSGFIVPVDTPNTGLTILAKTIWGEARGEETRGKIAVAWVVVNRVRRQVSRWGMTVENVCLKPKQFSCWNLGDPNRPKLDRISSDDASYRECEAVARGVLSGTLADPTGGATHYHVKDMSPKPKWARKAGPGTLIGGHEFYCNID